MSMEVWLTRRWREMDSNLWYRCTKAMDFRGIWGLRGHRRAPNRYPRDGSALLLLRTTGQKRRQIRPTSARGRGQEAPVSKRDRIRLLTARGLLVENGTRPQRITSKLRSSALVS